MEKSLKIFVKHNLCEGQLDYSLGRVCQKLIVDGQAPEVLQPGERTLHYPSFGQYGDLGRALVRTENHFHCPSELFGPPISKSPVISAVRQYLRKTRKLVIKLLNHLRSALAVMNVGLMNRYGHWEAKCVNHNVFLASFDFLSKRLRGYALTGP